jgi:hypothetical protein
MLCVSAVWIERTYFVHSVCIGVMMELLNFNRIVVDDGFILPIEL